MKNSLVLFALVISFSSCSIFKDSSKQKTKSSLDSTGSSKRVFKSIDTGTVSSYERLTLYFQPGTFNGLSKAGIGNNYIKDFASGLIDATRDLANASVNLQDSAKESPVKSSGNKVNQKRVDKSPGILNLPGLLAAAFEKGSTEKKGVTINNATEENSNVDKKNSSVVTEDKANPKAAAVVSLLVYFTIAIVLIGLFLWYKSRR